MEVSASSLNKSDCFILDQGKKHDILVLMPPGAKKMEQFRANQVATQIRDEDHAGNAEVKLIGHTLTQQMCHTHAANVASLQIRTRDLMISLKHLARDHMTICRKMMREMTLLISSPKSWF